MISDLDREIIRQTIEKIREQVKKLNESIASLEDLIRDKTTENKFFSDSCKRMSFDGYSANNIFGSKYAEKIDDTSTDDILHMDFGNDMPDFGLFVKWMSNKMDDSFFIGHTKIILLDNNKVTEVEELISEQYSSPEECFKEANLNMLNTIKIDNCILVGPSRFTHAEYFAMFASKAKEKKMFTIFADYSRYSIDSLINSIASCNHNADVNNDIYIIGIGSMCYNSDVYESAEEEFLTELAKLDMTYKITYTKLIQIYPAQLTEEKAIVSTLTENNNKIDNELSNPADMLKTRYLGHIITLDKNGKTTNTITELIHGIYRPFVYQEAYNATFKQMINKVTPEDMVFIQRCEEEAWQECYIKDKTASVINVLSDISEMEYMIKQKYHVLNNKVNLFIVDIDEFKVDSNYKSADEQLKEMMERIDFELSITYCKILREDLIADIIKYTEDNEDNLNVINTSLKEDVKATIEDKEPVKPHDFFKKHFTDECEKERTRHTIKVNSGES